MEQYHPGDELKAFKGLHGWLGTKQGNLTRGFLLLALRPLFEGSPLYWDKRRPI